LYITEYVVDGMKYLGKIRAKSWQEAESIVERPQEKIIKEIIYDENKQ